MPTRSNGFGTESVSGRNRAPRPADNSIACVVWLLRAWPVARVVLDCMVTLGAPPLMLRRAALPGRLDARRNPVREAMQRWMPGTNIAQVVQHAGNVR